jgi:2-polyprenyl-3-methyl-5-hydroxy-6-metoxy-1,4-benzoquinol methylase
MYTIIRNWISYNLFKILHNRSSKRVKYVSFTKKSDSDLDEYIDIQSRNPSKRQALDWLADDSLLNSTFSLLDVGCGPGSIPNMIIHHPNLKDRVEYVGVDQSENAIRYCRDRLPENYVMMCRDVLSEGLPEGSFDVIMINAVLEHILSYEQLISSALEKKPTILAINTFAVLINRKRDRILWNPEAQAFMNSYSFEKFFQYLRNKIECPILICHYESRNYDRYWFPRKNLMIWYLRLASKSTSFLKNK